MFVGHYGVAFGARAYEKRIPLWVYFLAVQWLDVVWCVLVYFNVEIVRIQPGVNPSGPLVFEYYPYTHSLLAATCWATVAACFYFIVTGKGERSKVVAGILGLCVLSHWLLDLVVHQPDLGLFNDSYKVGLGLWDHPVVEMAVELSLALGGLLLYFRKSPELTFKRRFATVSLCAVIVAVQLASKFGPPPQSARVMAISGFVAYLAFALWTFFSERQSGISRRVVDAT